MFIEWWPLRFVTLEPYGGPALSATVGALLCEGGQLEEGSEALLQSGALAASLGYRHAAFKLAATAVQFNPSKQTRLAAEGIGGSIATAPLPVADTDEIRTEPRPKALNMSQSIVHAIRTADHAHVDPFDRRGHHPRLQLGTRRMPSRDFTYRERRYHHGQTCTYARRSRRRSKPSTSCQGNIDICTFVDRQRAARRRDLPNASMHWPLAKIPTTTRASLRPNTCWRACTGT